MAQELEPRALTNLPIGINFAVLGYGYASGNILFDPALPLDDTKADVHSFVAAYARSISFFGLPGKIDAVVPYGIGDWTSIYTGIDTATSRHGFGDLRLRISFNFLGGKALSPQEFANYNPKTISGISIQVIAPTGQYYPDRLINLGSNRWTFKSQWGISKNFDKWIWETYVSLWLFTPNTDFWGGNELKQKPLYAIKTHGILKLPRGMWAALSVGYGRGAVSRINDVVRDSRISTLRLGFVYAMPIGTNHTIRFNAITGIRLEKGADFDAFTVSYQYRWFRDKKKIDKF